MRHKLPININPLSIRLPITALVSITHRLSGLLVFVLLPGVLWAFYHSLKSPESYAALRESLSTPWMAFLIWLMWSAFWFHLLAGVRHLLMDVHVGMSLIAARRSAALVWVFTLAGSVGLALRLMGAV
ncbi:MAG: succinate dehydrogenase, cytochrome b556 subunit [Pseudomonadota bacterium]